MSLHQITYSLVFAVLNVLVALLIPQYQTTILLFAAVIAGVSIGTLWCFHCYQIEQNSIENRLLFQNVSDIIISQKQPSANLFTKRMLVSETADPVIEKFVDFILRDFVFSFYEKIVPQNDDNLRHGLKNETWIIVCGIVNRIRAFDEKFITKDIMEVTCKHIRKVNSFLQKKEKFELSSHLKSTELELEFLRRLSVLLLAVFVPKVYLDISPLKHLLREALAVQVLYNSIETLSEPDFINQKLFDYLKICESESEHRKKTKYAFAETFDDFIEMIRKCSDVKELNRIRYFIVTEIMQASAMNNLKHERGMDLTKERNVRGSTTKGDHLLSRNLPRYLNQLKFAKRTCEKRIALLADQYPEKPIVQSPHVPTKKIIFPFSLIMANEKARQPFLRFISSLKNASSVEQSAQHLVSFWELVNQMKVADKVKQVEIAHQLLSHSYYLSSINSHTKIPKEIIKEMENFILGNVTPLAFYKTQKVVFKVLEERYFPLFVVSKFYDEMTTGIGPELNQEARKRKVTFADTTTTGLARPSSCTSLQSEHSVVSEHLAMTENVLKQANSTLERKKDSLTALKQSRETNLSASKSETTKRIIGKLEKEVEDVKKQISGLENHISRTLQWLDFQGEWRAELYHIDIDNPDSPMAAIIVHPGSLNDDSNCDAWLVARSITEIIDLKRKLVKIKSSLSRVEIYRLRNLRDDSSELLAKAAASMNEFFREILADERLFKTEDVYLFFSPSPNELRRPIVQRRNPNSKKMVLPFANLLGLKDQSSSKEADDRSDEDEEMCQFFEELSAKEGMKDDVAEPAYNLLNEVFELREGVGWIRKSLIAFVQISYGKTINKQIHETVSWLTSGTMFAYYLNNFMSSIWPDGHLVAASNVRTRDQRDRTYTLAKQKLLQNIPDLLISLMGENTSKQGVLKVFDILQQKELNKQLLYELLQVFVRRLIPELDSSSSNTHQVSLTSERKSSE